MAYDATFGGREPPSCKACQLLIEPGQPSLQVAPEYDPQDVSGLYHEPCGKPIAALARVLDLLRGASAG